MKTLLVILSLLSMSAFADTPYLVDAQTGKYLGNLSANKNDINSINNPNGLYGNPGSILSVKNPNGLYGSPNSIRSPNNPNSVGGAVRVIQGRD